MMRETNDNHHYHHHRPLTNEEENAAEIELPESSADDVLHNNDDSMGTTTSTPSEKHMTPMGDSENNSTLSVSTGKSYGSTTADDRVDSPRDAVDNDAEALPGLHKVEDGVPYSLSSRCLSCFLDCMGFSQNPFAPPAAAVESSSSPSRNTAAADMRLSLLSNFSTAYNVVNISLALDLLESSGRYAALSETQESWCTSALIAGMIVGQIAGGTLGDVLGRHWAMTIVMWLQVLASLGSATVWDGSNVDVYGQMARWRFVLGLGAGGVYPLAATLTAESSGQDDGNTHNNQSNSSSNDKAKSVALTFMMQGVGILAVPLVTRILVAVLGSESQWTWRLLLGFGAFPGILLTWMRIRRSASTNGTPTPRQVPVSVWKAIRAETDLVRKFVGTGGCWFLFDILFYGNTLFQPLVLEQAFGSSETVAKTARDSMYIALLALPGYFVSIYALGKQSPRWIQVQGFAMMGFLYLTIAIAYNKLADFPTSLLIVYGATFFFSNYGPNATTFLLPSMTYSHPCRSTLNGLCAACGKLGALLGTSVFGIAEERFGHGLVFGACGFVSIIGAVLTWYCVSPDVGAAGPRIAVPTNVPIEADDPRQLATVVPMKTIWSRPSLFDFPSSTSIV